MRRKKGGEIKLGTTESELMKYTYHIELLDENRIEIIESNYLPRYVSDKDCDIWLEIIGKECGYRYYPTLVRIKCIFVRI